MHVRLYLGVSRDDRERRPDLIVLPPEIFNDRERNRYRLFHAKLVHRLDDVRSKMSAPAVPRCAALCRAVPMWVWVSKRVKPSLIRYAVELSIQSLPGAD